MPLPVIAFLFLSAALALIQSHVQLLWTDEFYALESDSVAGIARLVHMQLTTPISLDPLVYNACAHATIRLFGAGPFAIRLPSICGFLLMQLCLFYFVRRVATDRAAAFAVAFPALAGIADYSIQGRPYGLWLGLSALAMVSWQTAIRRPSNRTSSLVVLFLSVVLALNTHYYGVLLLVPLYAAEAVRTLESRRVDVPMLTSILAASAAGILLLLPFARGVSQFRAHYFEHGVSFHFVSHAFLWLLIGYVNLSIPTQHILGACFLIFLAGLTWSFFRLRPTVVLSLSTAEVVFVCTLAALPVFGFVLARLATGVIEARYTLPAIIGITVVLSILIAPLLEKKLSGRMIVGAMFVAIAATGAWHIRTERLTAQRLLASLRPDSTTEMRLEATRGRPIYVTNPGTFQFVTYYAPSADLRSRLTLAYSRQEEMQSHLGDHLSLTAANMRADGVPHVVPYEPLTGHGAERLFLFYPVPWDWTGQALSAAHAQIKPLGTLLGANLVSVRFP